MQGVVNARRIITGCFLVLGAVLAGCLLHCDSGQPAMAVPAQDMMPALSSLRFIAGGSGGPGSLDGTGPAARFGGPSNVAMDGAGNLYIADSDNNTIRKMVVSTGVVTTLAGAVGMGGSADGTGSAARFCNPQGMAADGAGNLYVADTCNDTIRKVVVATGVVTTLAGAAGMSGLADGTGTGALFYDPQGVALDGAGNLYVADWGNNAMRKVVVATGVVTTLAGDFFGSQGVAFDGAGNLYVAGSFNNIILKVVVATGVATILAGAVGISGSMDGTGHAARFNRPVGVAVDGAGNVYVADSNNNTIRKVVVATGVVTTLAGAAGISGSMDGTGNAARFSCPHSVAVDGAGNLYVVDSKNNTIRKVAVDTGVVTTVAGTVSMPGSTDGSGNAARFNLPYGVAVDGAGNAYVADTYNHTIRKVVVATGVVTTLAGAAGISGSADGTGNAAQFQYPYGVAVDGAGNLYVADTYNYTIRKVVVATGVVTTLAGAAGIWGNADGTGNAAQFHAPYGVAVDGAGNLYVADTYSDTIRQVVVATGAVTTLAGVAGWNDSTDGMGNEAQFDHPQGVAVDGAGNLYVTDTNNHTLRQVVIATGMVTTLAGAAGLPGSTDGTGNGARFYYPQGVAVDGFGNLYVADTYNHTIRKIVLANASVTTLVGVPGQFGVTPGPLPAVLGQPGGLAVAPAGDLLLTDLSEHAVLGVR